MKKRNKLFTKNIFFSNRKNLRDSRIIVLKLKLFGKVSFIIAQLKLASCRYNQDSPRTWTKETNETRKIEDLADESSNNEQTSDTEDLQDNRNDQKAKKEKIILSTDFCTYQLARTISPSDHRDSTETLSKLSNSNLGKMKKFFYFSLYFLFFSIIYIFFVRLSICFIYFFSCISL